MRTDAVTITRLSYELNLDPGVAVAAIVSEEIRWSIGSGDE